MLLEFRMANFKSFREEMCFKMIPAQKITGLEHSLIKKVAANKEQKALSVAAIYGPNAAGKTNIIGGMEVFRTIILRGEIKDRENPTSLNVAVDKLGLIPNINSTEDEPVSFYIKFIVQNLLVEISLKLAIGTFFQADYKRKIFEEELKINGKAIYSRKEERLSLEDIESIKAYQIEGFDAKAAETIAKNNLDVQELFFNGMFKTLYSKKLYDIIYKWFENDFKIVYRADAIKTTPIITQAQKDKKFYVDKEINKVATEFGITSDEIVYPITDNSEQMTQLSVISLKARKQKIVVPSEFFESFGTSRFLNIFPIILDAIKEGYTLLIDELDASIHPMAVMNLINIFHNDEINQKGAQLIFNTHNPIFLNSALLRRDEIKFVEKDEKGSSHYSLSDFGTSGENGVRKGEDYMKNYFINKYGAIKNVDFSEVFEK